MIRFLIYSLCVLVLVSCKSYQPVSAFQAKKQEVINPYFADLNQEYIYSVTISAYQHTISGLLVIKALNPTTHRVLLTTEFGNTLLDVTINATGYTKNYAMPDLDKKIILNLLSHDFLVLMQKNWQAEAFWSSNERQIFKATTQNKNYFLTFENTSLKEITYAKKNKKFTILFESAAVNSASKIQIKHFNIDVTMAMQRL